MWATRTHLPGDCEALSGAEPQRRVVGADRPDEEDLADLGGSARPS